MATYKTNSNLPENMTGHDVVLIADGGHNKIILTRDEKLIKFFSSFYEDEYTEEIKILKAKATRKDFYRYMYEREQ